MGRTGRGRCGADVRVREWGGGSRTFNHIVRRLSPAASYVIHIRLRSCHHVSSKAGCGTG